MAPERLPREQYQICIIKTMREQKVSVKQKKCEMKGEIIMSRMVDCTFNHILRVVLCCEYHSMSECDETLGCGKNLSYYKCGMTKQMSIE